MGEHLSLERYYWFDAQVHAGLFPNAATLAGHMTAKPLRTVHELYSRRL